MEELNVFSASCRETRQIALSLARLLAEGDFLALEGDLGAGKTCFVKGLAEGLEAPVTVTSPTFTLIHEYLGGRLPLYHFDVYRLKRQEELEGLGYEEYFYGDGVCAVEWSDLIRRYLPKDYLLLRFLRTGEEMTGGGAPAGQDRAAAGGKEGAGFGGADPLQAADSPPEPRRLNITANGLRSRQLLEELDLALKNRP